MALKINNIMLGDLHDVLQTWVNRIRRSMQDHTMPDHAMHENCGEGEFEFLKTQEFEFLKAQEHLFANALLSVEHGDAPISVFGIPISSSLASKVLGVFASVLALLARPLLQFILGLLHQWAAQHHRF